ncbi:Afadin and alpha-actinin-binding-domain-containing protein [Phlebopus sp. FC_14]|nr:Afadin and alpha-actinin-binding-domain-containing protein [Phlebopus sp. FC_14]
MAEGSRKFVQWATDVPVSEPESPSIEASSSTSFTSTSTLQYINSQLVAHGFTTSPGISVEGISDRDCEGIAKCLLAMLSQRVNDMSRTEDLSTKLRTLSYEHERVTAMHHAATERAANAEREINVFKSRLATANRALQSSEAAHKQTTTDLQRAKSSLQALRATHAAEIRKKEKDIERMIEKWTKLADSQIKLSSASSGLTIRGANAEVSSAMDTLGKGKGYLEVALEHAETSRAELLDETTRLRRLVVMSANRVQALVHEIRSLTSIKEEEAASLDHDALFPVAPMNAANDKLLSLFASADGALSVLSKRLVEGTAGSRVPSAGSRKDSDPAERKTLLATMGKLQTELEEAKKVHETGEDERRAPLDQAAEKAIPRTTDNGGVDLLVAPQLDAERNRLDRIKKELDSERQEFTEATMKFGREKAVLERERVKFQEEKRSMQVQPMLAELPPTPAPDDAITPCYPPPSIDGPARPKKSPRKSPRKQRVVGKTGGTRKSRVSRRSSIFSIPPPTKVEPAYETEVIPIAGPALETATHSTTNLARSILPTSFVLPPPSPRTSLPPPPETLLGSTPTSPPNDDGSSVPGTPEKSHHKPTATQPDPQVRPSRVFAAPQTPPAGGRHFPMAKPLAPHMIHAYSPVKPSPLSRILMLANSPESPELESLETSQEVEVPSQSTPESTKHRDDSPLREKRPGRNAPAETRAAHGGTYKRLPKEKRTKAEVVACSVTNKTKSAGTGEKENRNKTSRKIHASQQASSFGTSRPELPGKASMKMPGKLAPGKGGARRVPINSAEAAPLPGWRG